MQEQHFITGDGVLISYSDGGSGPPVLLLHGFTMSSAMWWANGVVDALEGKVRLLIPDVRGHGASARPIIASSYGVRLVDDIGATLDDAGIEQAHIIGFSMGAETALMFATRTPQRVASLMMIGSGWSGAEAPQIYRDFARWARDTGAVLCADPDFDAFDALAAASEEHSDLPASVISRLSIPMHGVTGSEDPERANLEKLQRLLPAFTLDILPGERHETSWRHPSIPETALAHLYRAGALR